jgi:DedD protein
MQDEAFHEIQLNGKQLVFLFMAATVVAVVIFLSGVMVGRGVEAQRASVTEEQVDPAADPTAVVQTPAATTAASGASGAPVTAQETLTYPQRLETPTPPIETLKAPAEPIAPTTSTPTPPVERAAEPVAAAPVRPAPAPARVAAPLREPAGTGFVVQVAAVNKREEAETIARRLGGKGYPAFVTTPAGVASVFRVRVGKYDSRREAESVAGRLEKEEQFKPWITR